MIDDDDDDDDDDDGDDDDDDEDDDDRDDGGVGGGLHRRDLKVGQLLMTCGKLSNLAPSMKSRLNGSLYSSA